MDTTKFLPSWIHSIFPIAQIPHSFIKIPDFFLPFSPKFLSKTYASKSQNQIVNRKIKTKSKKLVHLHLPLGFAYHTDSRPSISNFVIWERFGNKGGVNNTNWFKAELDFDFKPHGRTCFRFWMEELDFDFKMRNSRFWMDFDFDFDLGLERFLSVIMFSILGRRRRKINNTLNLKKGRTKWKDEEQKNYFVLNKISFFRDF